MLLRLKTSELEGGGGGADSVPQVERVFKSPGKVGLKLAAASSILTAEHLHRGLQTILLSSAPWSGKFFCVL